VLAGAPSLLETIQADKLLPATNSVPERFELGTLPYELLAGTTAAIDVLAGLDDAAAGSRRERLATSLAALEEYEDDLRRPLESALASLPGVRVHSRAVNRTPTLLVTFDGRDAGDAYRFLAARNVNAPAGSFYAIEPSRRLGLGDAGGLRIGLAPYTDAQDVDRLLEGLQEFTAASH
jgi:selenocysteine lyase/cysteine desulfurase